MNNKMKEYKDKKEYTPSPQELDFNESLVIGEMEGMIDEDDRPDSVKKDIASRTAGLPF